MGPHVPEAADVAVLPGYAASGGHASVPSRLRDDHLVRPASRVQALPVAHVSYTCNCTTCAIRLVPLRSIGVCDNWSTICNHCIKRRGGPFLGKNFPVCLWKDFQIFRLKTWVCVMCEYVLCVGDCSDSGRIRGCCRWERAFSAGSHCQGSATPKFKFLLVQPPSR